MGTTTQRLEQTADTLIRAFFRGGLQHTGPCSCAVGVLCQGEGAWTRALWPIEEDRSPLFTEGLRLLEKLPYSIEEISQIEGYFEQRIDTPTLNSYNDPDGFKGLSNVLELLYKLDEEEILTNNQVDITRLCEYAIPG